MILAFFLQKVGNDTGKAGRKVINKIKIIMTVSCVGSTVIACNSQSPLKEDPKFTELPGQKEAIGEDLNKREDGAELGKKNSKSNLNDGLAGYLSSIVYKTEEDLLKGIGFGVKQTDKLCEMHAKKVNRVIKSFCIDKIRPKSLVDLQKSLGLAILNPSLINREENGTNGNPGFALVGHSTSLVGRSVTALNPRAIFFTPPDSLTASNLDFTILSFVRGEQLLELAAFDGQSRSLEFYLLHFTQACNTSKGGCQPGELLTPDVEQNWEEVTVYSMDQLKNTVFDCLHCHQPQGPTAARSLRMQELDTPWTHWFSNDTIGLELINDYYAMHGKDEVYAGIPGPMIEASSPALLEKLILKTGFTSAQINEFNSRAIELQITTNNPRQPADNSTPGVSDIWQFQYNQSKTSLLPPIPYHDLKVTEFSAAAKAVNFYRSYLQGRIPARKLPDFSDLLKTDQNERAKMGFAIEKESPAVEILTRACGQCHNSRLDQSLSKARFNVDLDAMQNRNEMLNEAIRRVQLGYSPERLKSIGLKFVSAHDGEENSNDSDDTNQEVIQIEKGGHVKTMPPKRFRELTDDQIDKLVAFFISKKIK